MQSVLHTGKSLITAVLVYLLSAPLIAFGSAPQVAALSTPLIKPKDTESPEFAKAVNQLKDKLSEPVKPDPFILGGDIYEFDWCKPTPRRNLSFKDLNNRLERDSALTRDFAQLHAATGSEEAYAKALKFALSWSRNSTVFNAYSQGASPSTATFPGMEDGYCNRSWHMMLDSIWQTYGLINFSEAFLLLKRSRISEQHKAELAQIEQWLRETLVPAVNAGFQSWTKFADANPKSRAFIRYRSDNHLSWSLAGLATAGLALNDKPLLDYVYYGTTYDDGIAGPYENPSALIKLIPYAIKPSGEIYDEAERTKQHRGFFYGNFSLWALVISAINTEKAGYPPLWEKRLSAEAGTISDALDRYAPYVANTMPIPDNQEKTKPEFFSFVYRLVLPMKWIEGKRRTSYEKAAESASSQIIRQGLGSIDLIAPLPKNINTD